jgi:hypothetical protein
MPIKAHSNHLRSVADLKTTRDAIRAGFVTLALERNRRATPHVAQARALQAAVQNVKKATDLQGLLEIQPALLTAAGISDKAAGHLEAADKKKAIAGLIDNFLKPAGQNFVEELVFRFLLTRGDTLGGSMRNVGGFLAQCHLSRAIVADLRLTGTPFRWLHRENRKWSDMPEDDAGLELQLRGLSWGAGKQARTLQYNVGVSFIKSNIDLVLFRCGSDTICKKIIDDPKAYIALGELKGGIDPAGADEHWKTARSAFDRIRDAFGKKKLRPHTFFIGAAIESRMADEIWEMLQDGRIENAANMTDDAQLASIARWVCSL